MKPIIYEFKMIIFDYIYFRIFNFYKKEKDRNPAMSTAVLVSLPQSFNIISILYSVGVNLNTNYNIAINIIIAIFNIIYYNEYRRENILKNIENRVTQKQHGVWGAIIVLYYVFSFIVFFISMAIARS